MNFAFKRTMNCLAIVWDWNTHTCHRRNRKSTMRGRITYKKSQKHLKVAVLNAHNCLLPMHWHVESIMQNYMLSNGIYWTWHFDRTYFLCVSEELPKLMDSGWLRRQHASGRNPPRIFIEERLNPNAVQLPPDVPLKEQKIRPWPAPCSNFHLDSSRLGSECFWDVRRDLQCLKSDGIHYD